MKNTFANYTEGQQVIATSQHGAAMNICRFICADRTGLGRDIAYFQFSERGHKTATPETLNENGVFAIWGHEVGGAYSIAALQTETA